jgi:hypothetical protein
MVGTDSVQEVAEKNSVHGVVFFAAWFTARFLGTRYANVIRAPRIQGCGCPIVITLSVCLLACLSVLSTISFPDDNLSSAG